MNKRSFIKGALVALLTPEVVSAGGWVYTSGKWDVFDLPKVFGKKTYCGEWKVIGDGELLEDVVEVDLDNNIASIYQSEFDKEGRIIKKKVQLESLYMRYEPIKRK